jgi:hypothetical protein
MARIIIYKTQRIGGNKPQFMQSIGLVEDRDVEESTVCVEEAESVSPLRITYEEWLESKDEEIGYWESIYPFWW